MPGVPRQREAGAIVKPFYGAVGAGEPWFLQHKELRSLQPNPAYTVPLLEGIEIVSAGDVQTTAEGVKYQWCQIRYTGRCNNVVTPVGTEEYVKLTVIASEIVKEVE